jgi:hypothetical protein
MILRHDLTRSVRVAASERPPISAVKQLTDAALHTEKQTIIWATRIVDAIEVDDAGIDETAELEQVMPVPAVAGETGGVEAKHGADLASAEPGDEPLEARARYGPTGGSAEVVIDELDIAETPTASFCVD